MKKPFKRRGKKRVKFVSNAIKKNILQVRASHIMICIKKLFTRNIILPDIYRTFIFLVVRNIAVFFSPSPYKIIT